MKLIVAASVALALVGGGAADHCTTWMTSAPEVSAAGSYYVDFDFAFEYDEYSVWVYEESNGLAGLQRGDDIVDDTCHDMIAPDTIIF